MCALFGYLDYGKHVPWRVLQKLVQALANRHFGSQIPIGSNAIVDADYSEE